MADKNEHQEKDTPENQKSAFVQAIHAPSMEDKGRVLQQHPELTNIVNVYDEAVKSHPKTNKEFWEAFDSGKYEAMLAEDVLKGRLKMYDAAVEKQPETPLAVINKAYDKQSGMLQGFDINLGQNEKPLHVDLQQYAPPGKTSEETKQLREDFADIYQATIKRNPVTSEGYFGKIAELFPKGIAWQAPDQGSQADVENGVLKMQGNPNVGVIASQAYSDAFLRKHGEAAMAQHTSLKEVESPDAMQSNLQGVAAAINRGDHFTDEQKLLLNTMMATKLNQNGFSVAETRVQERQLEQAAERTLG